jgi:hypothetical protein
MTTKKTAHHWSDSFFKFIDEFKGESDRAAVILGAAKLDALLAQLLDRVLLPSIGSNDELLDGDSPLATFSARINACYRLGLIGPAFAKTLHLVRRIRNAFAHEAVGVSLESGAHADRLKSLLLPLHALPFFIEFRDTHFDGESTPSNNFRVCLALLTGRLEALLHQAEPFRVNNDCEFLLDKWKTNKPVEDAKPS